MRSGFGAVVAKMPPLSVSPREGLRSGLRGSVLRRLACTACRQKIDVVGVSGTLTTVGCVGCGRQWLVNPAGRAVRV